MINYGKNLKFPSLDPPCPSDVNLSEPPALNHMQYLDLMEGILHPGNHRSLCLQFVKYAYFLFTWMCICNSCIKVNVFGSSYNLREPLIGCQSIVSITFFGDIQKRKI